MILESQTPRTYTQEFETLMLGTPGAQDLSIRSSQAHIFGDCIPRPSDNCCQFSKLSVLSEKESRVEMRDWGYLGSANEALLQRKRG